MPFALSRFLAPCLALTIASGAIAAPALKPLPYLTVMPKYHVHPDAQNHQDIEFDSYPMFDGRGFVNIEGRVLRRTYSLTEGAPEASALQIARNITNAVKAASGTVLHDGTCTHPKCSDDIVLALPAARTDVDRMVTARLNTGGKEVWIEMVRFGGQDYFITAVERGEMRQDLEVSAAEMLKALNVAGRISLQIQFDTAKATIRPDSAATIKQIHELLKTNSQLKIMIEGHTDNVGQAKANQKLSEERAAAVAAALVSQGIAANRLTAAGFGQERPVADNTKEDGRAKNRRVDLVKR